MNSPDTTIARNAASAKKGSGRGWVSSLRLWDIALVFLLIVSVVLNVLLARRINQLTAVQNAVMVEHQLKVGTQVPVIQANDHNGQRHTIAFNQEDKPTVLYVFTPPCKWCERNMDNIKELVTRKGDEFRFIGVSLSKEGLPEYLAKNGLTMPVYIDLSEETRKAYKMGGTPQTIVVSHDGVVLQSWMGAYAGEQQKQVEEYFGLKLPGVKAENK